MEGFISMKKIQYKPILLFFFIILFILIGNPSYTQNEDNNTNNTDVVSNNENDEDADVDPTEISTTDSDENADVDPTEISTTDSKTEDTESNTDDIDAVILPNKDRMEKIEIESEIYSILQYAGTGDDQAFNGLPAYLQNAVYFSEYEEDKSLASKNVLKYIRAEDMNIIMALLVRDAKNYTEEEEETTETEEIREEINGETEEEDDSDGTSGRSTYPTFDSDDDLEEVYEEYEYNIGNKEESDDFDSSDSDETEDDTEETEDDTEETEDDTEETEDDDSDEVMDDQNNNQVKHYNLSESEKNRIKFVMQLTGIKYNDAGFPIRDEEGRYKERLQSEWMKKTNIKKINVMHLTEVLLNGLYNKDPMVRISCLNMLKSMGPHPVMLPDMLKATGEEINLSIDLDRETLSDVFGGETVGNIDRAFYIQERVFGYVENQNTEETEDDTVVKKILKPSYTQEKYEYIDVNGDIRKEIPFLMFRTFLFKLLRIDIVYKMERDSNFAGLKTVRKSALESLTQDIDYTSSTMYDQPEYNKVDSEEEKEEKKKITTSNWSFVFYDDEGNEKFSSDDDLTIKFLSIDEEYSLIKFSLRLNDNTTMTLKEEVNLIKNDEGDDNTYWKVENVTLINKDEQEQIIDKYELEFFFDKDLTKIDRETSFYKPQDSEVEFMFEAEVLPESVKIDTETMIAPVEEDEEDPETMIAPVEENEDEYDYSEVPIYLYLEGVSAFKYLAGKSLLPYDNVDYTKINNVNLTKTEEVKIVKTLIDGLENRNFFIRIKIAGILYDVYSKYDDNEEIRTPTESKLKHRNNIKRLILKSCITSQEMRNALYEEIYNLYENETTGILNYLSTEDSNKLKDVMGL